MKSFNKTSVLLALAILAGLFSSAVPAHVVALATSPKMSVFELVTSPT